MEFLYELLFTALFAFFFSLLVAKLVSVASTYTTDTSPSKAQRTVSADVAIERRREGGAKTDEDGKAAHSTAEVGIYESVGGDGDSFESSGTVGEKTGKIEVYDVAVEKRCEEVVKLEELDEVEEEIEHLRVEEEIVGNFGGDFDSFESSGTIFEKTEKIGVDCDRLESPGTIGEKTENIGVDDVAVEKRCEEVVKLEELHDVDEEIEHLRAEDEIVGHFGGDCDSFESSGTISEKTGKIEVDDVAVEKRCVEVVKLEELDEVEEEIEHLRVEDEIVGNFGGDCDSFESSGTICEKTESIGVYEVAVERRFGGAKSEEFDGVGEIIAEHLKAEDEIVQSIRGDGDSFESSGTIGESIEKTVVDDVAVKRCEEVILEEFNVDHPTVDGVIVKDVGGVGDSFQSSVVIGENIQKSVFEGEIKVEIGSSDPVDDVAVEERSKMGKFVEQVWTTYDTFESSGAKNDINESVGVEGDIMVNSGRNNPAVTYEEVAVGEKNDESEHKIGEHVGVDNVNFENSGTNAESVESVLVGGDIKLSSCSEVDDEDDDDDWEGIERSELEESFAAAANYVFRVDKNVSEPKLDSNVKMELYGLNKVALEGPCREAQPLAIMVSARAKWNAWQKLGNMTPEVAMEQYISLLSEKAPKWMEGESSGDGSKYSSMALVSVASPLDTGTYTKIQLNPIEASVSELHSATDEEDLAVGSISVNKI